MKGRLSEMSEVERIEDQLRRAFEGEAWHGPSVREVLDGVSAEKAAARPIVGAHSIWELALHIAAWENAARRRLLGDRAQLTDEENFPPVVETDEAAWAATLAALEEGNRKLREEISRLSDSRLSEPIIEGMSSVYGTLHGVIQHTLYHAGQIALLKKA
jgi:uncharacterized damage-inducible protein DinB